MADSSEPPKASERIIPRDAAAYAAHYLSELVSINPTNPPSVEEVELSEDGKYWLITLSYSPLHPTLGMLMSSGREYKVFEVDAFTSEVKSMKIRKNIG
jgi:hypothetical protein